jgi:hypothetical protein
MPCDGKDMVTERNSYACLSSQFQPDAIIRNASASILFAGTF